VFPIAIGGLTIPCYAALASLVVNLIVTVVLTWLFNIVRATQGRDETVMIDYQEAEA
jgi:SSS family solute:Na+ symporter